LNDRPPRRVRVVLADRRPAPLPILRGAEVAEQTELGRELVGGLVRAQLAAALRIAAIALVLFAPLPLVFALLPGLADLRIIGVPLAWWVLGFLAYPVLYLLARLHRRQAERIEREFTDLLGQGEP
jgi:hypothetical protein